MFYVNPSERAVLIHRRGESPRCIDSGFHLLANLWLMRLDPRKHAFKRFGHFPALGTRVFLDPPLTQIHTSDGIPGTADISVECTVLEWTAEDIIRDSGCIYQRSCNLINQWLATQLTQTMADMCTYGELAATLNTAESLGALNKDLAQHNTFLSASRVIVDANGIQMNSDWVQQRNKINLQRASLSEREHVLRSELELERLERSKVKEAQTFDLELQKRTSAAAAEREAIQMEADVKLKKRKTQADIENARLEAEATSEVNLMRAQGKLSEDQVIIESRRQADESKTRTDTAQLEALLQAGLTSEQYTKLTSAKSFLSAMATCEGAKMIAVPPGLIGLGLDPPRRAAHDFEVVNNHAL